MLILNELVKERRGDLERRYSDRVDESEKWRERRGRRGEDDVWKKLGRDCKLVWLLLQILESFVWPDTRLVCLETSMSRR